ncbi:Poly-beta-1,6-N-acetyl-D-glucosamine N-deacetylase precursor [compost metagenome]
MVKKQTNSALNVRKKNINKVIKTIIQTVILLALIALLIDAVFDVQRYEEPDKTAWTQEDQGFIAISYFGVGRSASSKLVAKHQLDEQLGALYDQGYRTISQQDITDFYTKGKPLPPKALFLSFEDGRNDSSLFAQPLLEKYNYKATFLSYANKMGNSDRKFLQPKDMLKMAKTGYWELGTNGYRLTYINVFDKEGRYIGVKDENELTDKENIEYYNHYLMDFIRDENMIPIEDRDEMEERIQGDYKLMQDIYTDTLGYVPSVYMIMHSNALGEGMNPLVLNANSSNIHNMFQMHFNREGQTLNSKDDDIYDLTRIQPASYWSTNHLLMKIRKDTGNTMQFVRGDEKEAGKWNMLGGVAEFDENTIILTSPPAGSGKMYLNGSSDQRDVKVSFKASGNVIGKQGVYLRYDKVKKTSLHVYLENNNIIVEEQKPGSTDKPVFSQPLDELQWKEEDLAFDKASVYTKEQTASGVTSDKHDYPINIRNSRNFEVELVGQSLKIIVDDQLLVENLQVDPSISIGGIALEAKYNEQNEKDDIYDGVFEDLQVTSLGNESDDSSFKYSLKLSGIEGVVSRVKKAVNTAVNWTMDTF